MQNYKPKSIDELVKETRFTKSEIQFLYRGFKQACPSGTINEQMFKEIYQQYFPHGGLFNSAFNLIISFLRALVYILFLRLQWVCSLFVLYFGS